MQAKPSKCGEQRDWLTPVHPDRHSFPLADLRVLIGSSMSESATTHQMTTGPAYHSAECRITLCPREDLFLREPLAR